MSDQYELAERLSALADKIESEPEWFVDPDLDDGDLMELFREAAAALRDKE